jgi:hypothetical protein
VPADVLVSGAPAAAAAAVMSATVLLYWFRCWGMQGLCRAVVTTMAAATTGTLKPAQQACSDLACRFALQLLPGWMPCCNRYPIRPVVALHCNFACF